MSIGNVADWGVGEPVTERVYSNNGNASLLNLLDQSFNSVLDIGCGAGDNAVLVKAMKRDCEIFGITCSASESAIAQERMTKCWVADIEDNLPGGLIDQTFDVLIFSHVLEHLRDPATVLARYSRLLRRGGQLVIAVPNIVSWAMRFQFLLGDFRYQSSGVLDDTHLRFFTFFTADGYLLAKSL